MSKLGLSQGRSVTIAFDNGTDAQIASVVDAYKAAINKVEEFEGMVREGTQPADLSSTDILVTGTSSRLVYKFTVTTTFASGAYEFLFVESADNVDGLS